MEHPVSKIYLFFLEFLRNFDKNFLHLNQIVFEKLKLLLETVDLCL